MLERYGYPIFVIAACLVVIAHRVVKVRRKFKLPESGLAVHGPPEPKPESVVLHESRDERGSRALWAARHRDGRLVIYGQHLGSTVGEHFGAKFNEYEYGYTVAAGEVPALVQALKGEPGSDPIELLRQHLSEPKAYLHLLVGDNGVVPAEFWSRVGD
jgi:hypothetical protein